MSVQEIFEKYRMRRSMSNEKSAHSDLLSRAKIVRSKAPVGFLPTFEKILTEAYKQLNKISFDGKLEPGEAIEWTVLPNAISLERIRYDLDTVDLDVLSEDLVEFPADYEVVETLVEAMDPEAMPLSDVPQKVLAKLLPPWAYIGSPDDPGGIRVSAAAVKYLSEGVVICDCPKPFDFSNLEETF